MIFQLVNQNQDSDLLQDEPIGAMRPYKWWYKDGCLS